MFVRENWNKALQDNPKYSEEMKSITKDIIAYEKTRVAEYDTLSAAEKTVFQKKRTYALRYFENKKAIVRDERTTLLEDLEQLVKA